MPPLTAKRRAARVNNITRHARNAAEGDDDADQRRRTVRAAARCGLRHLDGLHDLSRSQAADKRRLAALHVLYELRDDDDHACDDRDAVALLPAGFANLGNTCFINAATQLLTSPLLCCLPANEQQGVTLASCASQAALRAALGLRCSHETLTARAVRADPYSFARDARADADRVRMHCNILCAQRIRGDLQTFAAALRWPFFRGARWHAASDGEATRFTLETRRTAHAQRR
jgi:hypothetical protein